MTADFTPIKLPALTRQATAIYTRHPSRICYYVAKLANATFAEKEMLPILLIFLQSFHQMVHLFNYVALRPVDV